MVADRTGSKNSRVESRTDIEYDYCLKRAVGEGTENNTHDSVAETNRIRVPQTINK